MLVFCLWGQQNIFVGFLPMVVTVHDSKKILNGADTYPAVGISLIVMDLLPFKIAHGCVLQVEIDVTSPELPALMTPARTRRAAGASLSRDGQDAAPLQPAASGSRWLVLLPAVLFFVVRHFWRQVVFSNG